MTLALFFLAKAALASLPTALFAALSPPFPFRQNQFVQVFPLNPTSFCNFSAGPGRTNKSAISFPLRLSLCPGHTVLFSVFTSNSLAHRTITVFSLLLYYQATTGSHPGNSFFPGNDTAAKRARRDAILLHCAVSCSLSPDTSPIHSCLFSYRRRTVSSKCFDTKVSFYRSCLVVVMGYIVAM